LIPQSSQSRLTYCFVPTILTFTRRAGYKDGATPFATANVSDSFEPGWAALNVGLLIERLFMRISHSRLIDGLWLGVIDKSDDDLLCRVEEALLLIKTYDVIRYEQIRRDVGRIWVCPLPGPRGSFSGALNACKLDSRFVKSSEPESIASTIVHEGTHARPCLRKIGYSEPLRHRIERICMMQQLTFLQKVPGGEKASEEVERNLAREASDWSDDGLKRLYDDGRDALARDLGIPSWMIRFALMIRKFRARFHPKKR